MSVRNFKNTTTVGTLTAPVASSAVTFTVNGFTGPPAVPFTATLDRNLASEEVVLVTAVAGGTLTVTRGYDGTAGQSHAAGATVEHTAGAIEYTEANQHVNATVGVHGTTGSLVGSDGTQTIFKKTLVSPVLQADPTAGDAAVAFIPPGAEARNLFRGIGSDGNDKITVDSTGKIATVAGASVAGNLTVTGTAAITGALTATGGVTVPAGKKATLTDAPAAGTDATNKTYVDSTATTAASNAAAPKADKTYVDGLVTSTGASRKLSYWWGSGTTFPTTGVITGDTYTRTDLGNTLWTYDGTNWWARPGSVVGKAWRTSGFSGNLNANQDYVVGLDAARVAGGVTFDNPTDRLTLPIDGMWRIAMRAYATGGPPPYDIAFSARRVRSAVGDLSIITYSFYKETGQDRMPVSGDTLPLKAADALYLQATPSVTGPNYWGATEVAGVMLSAEWVGPLNGATPI